jgi:hypothetical protein
MSDINNTETSDKVKFVLYNIKLHTNSFRKLYLMEPLCQTQMPTGGQDSSEMLDRLETQETKLFECEQRCRTALNDLQKVNQHFYIPHL